MATIKENVESYVGTVSDNNVLKRLYNQCLKNIITKLAVTDREALYRLSTTSSSASEVNLAGNAAVVLRVRRGSFPARKIPMEEVPFFDSTKVAGSIYTPTNIHPVWHWLHQTTNNPSAPVGGRVTVLPAPDATDKVFVEYVDYANLETSDVTTNTQLNKLPSEIGYIVIICTAMKACMWLIINATFPTFKTTAGLTAELNKLTTFIDTDEDVQLAQAQMQKVQTLVTGYGEDMREFQALVQKYMNIYETLAMEYNAFFGMVQPRKEKEVEA